MKKHFHDLEGVGLSSFSSTFKAQAPKGTPETRSSYDGPPARRIQRPKLKAPFHGKQPQLKTDFNPTGLSPTRLPGWQYERMLKLVDKSDDNNNTSLLYEPLSELHEPPLQTQLDSFVPKDEEWVQRLWFEGGFPRKLRTTSGEDIEILQPGFWNHGAGPDFEHASLRKQTGEIIAGLIEIHLTPEDWAHHSHQDNPVYNQVILHVCWTINAHGSTRDFFTSTDHHKEVPLVILEPQISQHIPEIIDQFESTQQEREVGALIGRCQRELDKLPEHEVEALLTEAGWWRFRSKAKLWKSRRELKGLEEALWQGIAEGLGYHENKRPMRLLSQRVPIGHLHLMKGRAEREALLFGLAGFLPSSTLPPGDKGKWPRQLWDHWWSLRAEHEEEVLPRSEWTLHSLRPLNRPERRLGALSALSAPNNWKPLLSAVECGHFKTCEKILKEVTHPFWNEHITVLTQIKRPGKQKRPHALIGASRVQSLMYNVIWPLMWEDYPNELKALLANVRSTQTNALTKRARVRLLSGRSIKGLQRLLIQEGLLQIYKDFCLTDVTQCEQCEFPELTRFWRA